MSSGPAGVKIRPMMKTTRVSRMAKSHASGRYRCIMTTKACEIRCTKLPPFRLGLRAVRSSDELRPPTGDLTPDPSVLQGLVVSPRVCLSPEATAPARRHAGPGRRGRHPGPGGQAQPPVETDYWL